MKPKFQDRKVGDIETSGYGYVTVTSTAFVKLVEQIRTFGFTDPVVVRNTAGKPQIVDLYGEHLWRAAVELQMDTIPVYNIGDVDEAEAMAMSLAFREIHGTPDSIRLADVLRQINTTADLARMAEVLPYDAHQLRHLIESVDFSFAGLSPKDTRPKNGGGGATKTNVKIKLMVPPSTAQRLAAIAATPEQALIMLLDDWDRRIAAAGTNGGR